MGFSLKYLNTSVPEVLNLLSTRVVRKRTIVIRHEVYTMEIQDLYLRQPNSVKLRAHVPSCSTVRDDDASSLTKFVLTL